MLEKWNQYHVRTYTALNSMCIVVRWQGATKKYFFTKLSSLQDLYSLRRHRLISKVFLLQTQDDRQVVFGFSEHRPRYKPDKIHVGCTN